MGNKIIKNKTVWVLYLNVGNKSNEEVERCVVKTREILKLNEYKDLVTFIIPVKNSETRIEVVQQI